MTHLLGKCVPLPIVKEFSIWNSLGDHPGVVELPDDHPDKLNGCGWIETLEGGYVVSPGDYIVTGVNKEYHAVKPDIFHATYSVILRPVVNGCVR